MQITAIILAGGKSKRMGTDKAMLEIGGITLLEKAVQLCKPVCSEIIISSNYSEHKVYGYKVVADEIENCGPMGGISSCLKKSNSDWNFVISVDSPFVESEFLNFLVSSIGDFDSIVPVSEKGKEPLIALYKKSCITEMKTMFDTGNYKMHNLINSINTKWIDSQLWLEKYPKLFHNLNQPDDL